MIDVASERETRQPGNGASRGLPAAVAD
ncbi:MAG: hypothetical protein JWN35_3507, partial [Frankiales bacterium]|nr:hypothetical protein [Frankiales bacterium]